MIYSGGLCSVGQEEAYDGAERHAFDIVQNAKLLAVVVQPADDTLDHIIIQYVLAPQTTGTETSLGFAHWNMYVKKLVQTNIAGVSSKEAT